jgi:hypothetical protein
MRHHPVPFLLLDEILSVQRCHKRRI